MSLNTDEFLIGVLKDYALCGHNKAATASRRGVPVNTLKGHITQAIRRGLTASTALTPPETPTVVERMVHTVDPDVESEMRTLRAELAGLRKESSTEEYIRRKLYRLSEQPVTPPEWLIDPHRAAPGSPGVPTLFASDWHWGEVVDPTQINGVNAFDLSIAHERVRRLITGTIDLLKNHMVNPSYPGIVFPLGGDMVTGNIHEELVATNDADIMPTVLDIYGVLVWCIETLADAFGLVFIPCVSGNHGRNTHKIWAKNRNFTSFDWLIYCFLEKHFEGDNRVQFYIPNGPDALFRIYNHTYLMTHGDQFRGGDGLIGALGPIIRGDHKKRGRQGQIGQPYDTMILGHWHQYMSLRRLIVNSSLKGYDEYANQNNFGYEPPSQALWITHPVRGITFSIPVYVDEVPETLQPDWVTWAS